MNSVCVHNELNKLYKFKINYFILKLFSRTLREVFFSDFNNLDGFGDLIGSVPKNLKVKCECKNLVDVELHLKGIYKVPEINFEHQYYLNISHKCESCGKKICIYRPRGPAFRPLLFFMNFLRPDEKFKMNDIENLTAWGDIFRRAGMKNLSLFQQIYREDVLKLGMFFMEMDERYKITD